MDSTPGAALHRFVHGFEQVNRTFVSPSWLYTRNFLEPQIAKNDDVRRVRKHVEVKQSNLGRRLRDEIMPTLSIRIPTVHASPFHPLVLILSTYYGVSVVVILCDLIFDCSCVSTSPINVKAGGEGW